MTFKSLTQKILGSVVVLTLIGSGWGVCGNPVAAKVKTMNTTKSDTILERYKAKNVELKRKSFQFSGTWEATPEEIFALLCPTREADWIPGWAENTRLIYTESGYAEDKVVFVTEEANPMDGKALWAFTGYKPNEYVKFVVLKDDFVGHVKIDVTDNGDGTSTGTWNATFTAITEQGNAMLDNMPATEVRAAGITKMINAYLANKDTSKSEHMLQRFQDSPVKYKRRFLQYGGTFETTMDTLFPLFCPTREADWIPGWDADLLYTESGYAEEKVIWRTPAGSFTGEGLWTITDLRPNELLEFVFYHEDLLTFVRLTAVDNGDGTITATWNSTFTALSEQGNQKIDAMPGAEPRSAGLSAMITHYLTTGETLPMPAGAHH